MTMETRLETLQEEIKLIKGLDIFVQSSELERFSRDYYDYSPILVEKLQNCRADLVVRPKNIESLLLVAKICFKHAIPLTVRGAGTGNYGQCVPLKGGVVLLMTGFSSIRHFDPSTGIVTVESGCLLKGLEQDLLSYGRQLRLVPSTWRSASIGGFIAGGSGGIGSVRWGFLRDPGHLHGLEVVTIEKEPQKLWLDASSAEALNHAYGTNGIITAVSIATTPSTDWQEVTIDCMEWTQAVELLIEIAAAAIDLNLASLMESKIVDQLPKWCGECRGTHRLFFLVSPDGITTLQRLAIAVGAEFMSFGSESFRTGNGLRELTWNHTTLHLRSVDPSWTYLQMLLPQPELTAMKELKRDWGENLLWHLEVVQMKGVKRLAALPLVRWKNKTSLERLINQCIDIGAVVFNPHVITVEDGGLGGIDAAQVETKRRFDPAGLLNPGKLKGWISK